VPDKYNSAKIPTRPSSRRPGVFSPVRDEPTFQEKDTPLQVWKPSGFAGAFTGAAADFAPDPDSDGDEFRLSSGGAGADAGGASEPAARASSGAGGARIKRKATIITDPKAADPNKFLRGSSPPSRCFSPEREIPARVAAMPEPERYFFQDWLANVRKRRAQVCHPFLLFLSRLCH
jgi:hypothetical protein